MLLLLLAGILDGIAFGLLVQIEREASSLVPWPATAVSSAVSTPRTLPAVALEPLDIRDPRRSDGNAVRSRVQLLRRLAKLPAALRACFCDFKVSIRPPVHFVRLWLWSTTSGRTQQPAANE